MKKGSSMSDESKQKMRLAKIGIVPWNKGVSSPGPMSGKKHSLLAREKMRLAKLGKPGNRSGISHTDKTKQKISESRKGKPAWNVGIEMSESFCKTMSRVQMGKTIPTEQRKKISDSLSGIEHSYDHNMKVLESNIGGFWYGAITYNEPKYCELWKDVNPRVHAFFDYKCCLCKTPESIHSHIGHHVFYVKKACCWHNEDGIYYTNLNASDHKEHDYCIGENPNYFVILCSKCHGKTNGKFANRKKWAEFFRDIIDSKYNGKCYFTKEEMGRITPSVL